MTDLFSETRASDGGQPPHRIDFAPLRAAVGQAVDWALNVAADTTDDDDDLERVGRVRRFANAALDGKTTRIPSEEDLLSVIAAVITAIDLDCGAPGVGNAVSVLIEELEPLLESCGQVIAPGVRPRWSSVPFSRVRRRPRLVRHLYCTP